MRFDVLVGLLVGLALFGFGVALTANWRGLSQLLADKMPVWWGGGMRWWWRFGGPAAILFGLTLVAVCLSGLLR